MVSARYPPFVGGVETHVHEVAPRIAERGLDVSVLTTDLTGDLPSLEREGSLTVRRFSAWPKRSDLYVSRALVGHIKEGGYDLVHVQGVNNFLPPMTLRAAQRLGLPTLATFHGGGHSSRVRKMVRSTQWRAVGPLLRRTKALIAVCHFEIETWSARLGIDPERIRLIRNGAEPLPVGTTPSEISGSPLVSSVGRLDRLKGHQRVIEAMPALLEIAPDAHLAVVGRGSFERELRRLAARLKIDDAVTFTSFDATQREELGALVDSSDVVVLMSEFEAHPVAVIEAISLGRKVVLADTSGLSELAAEGLAVAVPLDSTPHALAQVLLDVARRPDPVVPTLPTWDDCVDELCGLYEEILSGTSAGRGTR